METLEISGKKYELVETDDSECTKCDLNDYDCVWNDYIKCDEKHIYKEVK